ncbi:alkaline phosphatase D family protein [Bradyrhizobium prioriisuperbiae]|uniref:alkaline phosphatase D family protein n=1 Tax=Bradyrhizobium prioriisuperbiae TaxID=2854389 RepID=UPI0028F08C59|nr:alkaline phosphatase D family protein [Bradyrhizobium prioritasuperba]
MVVTQRNGAALTRRRFLTAVSSAAITAVGGIARPSLSRAADRPVITHGVQSGDVSLESGIVWTRTDRPARMLAEIATSDSFKTIHGAVSVDALPDTDFTAKALLQGLPAGQDVFYRVRFQDHSFSGALSEPQVGRFRTAPRDRRSISFVWSGDTGAWGIDEARGGMRTYATMAKCRPDFFIHSGDHIYADSPIPAESTLPNGEIWRNLVTEEKSKVAETLAEFRGNYKYNLLDRNLRAFNAEVPMLAQWDDHEVTNDWCPDGDPRMVQLAARGGRAFHEFMPIRRIGAEASRVYRKVAYGPLLDVFLLDMRSYRTALDEQGAAAAILGPAQMAWLKHELMNSHATWKIIAADLPIGVVSGDAVAQGDGPARGREIEIADLLTFIKRAGIRNTVWLTADMHYTAAHYYDPNAAVFQDFEPFWEFISGPLHAGTWPPQRLDNTFGPRAVFQKGCSGDQPDDLAPCFGLQFFGHVAIDGATEVMTVTLKDVDDRDLWATRIEPQTEKRSRESRLVRGGI